jgi:hypothetical protein
MQQRCRADLQLIVVRLDDQRTHFLQVGKFKFIHWTKTKFFGHSGLEFMTFCRSGAYADQKDQQFQDATSKRKKMQKL